MSYAFMFLLGKNKEELESLLADVEEKLISEPDNETLKAEKQEIEKLLEEK